jgi:sterol desaturase/sphingolipid hydroxylase (fatty acid hydroxylase superfamily)
LTTFLTENEPLLRFAVSVGVLMLIICLEFAIPRRRRPQSRLERWPGNILLILFNNLLMRFAVPLLAVDAALIAAHRGIGLLNFASLPIGLEIIVAVLALDALIYWQHVIFHKVGPLWRLHRVHHSDQDLDATSALRFHPIEIVLSMIIKVGAVFILGVHVAAVILFEIILNGMAMFNHGNFRIPLKLDRVLRWTIVTPDMHRIHHSTDRHEVDTNFGFNLSWWDKIFGTYKADPELGQNDMEIGLPNYMIDDTKNVIWMLLFPFKGKTER